MRLPEWRLFMLLLALLIASSVLWLALHPGSVTYPLARELPPKVLEAAEKALPGLKLHSYNSELFGTEPAWELRGYDAKGHFQRLDISDSGEVFMIEPD
jgi:hypothetical protein